MVCISWKTLPHYSEFVSELTSCKVAVTHGLRQQGQRCFDADDLDARFSLQSSQSARQLYEEPR